MGLFIFSPKPPTEVGGLGLKIKNARINCGR